MDEHIKTGKEIYRALSQNKALKDIPEALEDWVPLSWLKKHEYNTVNFILSMEKKGENQMNRYKEAVEKYGNICVLDDEIARQKETDVILNFFDRHMKPWTERVVDVGCGDGYTLEKLSEKYKEYDCDFFGFDITRELIDRAKERNLKNCVFIEKNATSSEGHSHFYDIVYTQRCIQNILSWGEQKKALDEIHRVLKPGGYYLMIEAFTDGLINNNKARVECGLPELHEAPFNKYLDKELFFQWMGTKFTSCEPNNFLSSHYFVSRVLHALVTKGEQKKNTEFVKFFSFLPPIGNYSPIQSFILRKK